MTLQQCKKQCEERSDCTAIDYGKNGRNQECYFNYGGKTDYNDNDDFDAYAVNRSGILVYLCHHSLYFGFKVIWCINRIH